MISPFLLLYKPQYNSMASFLVRGSWLLLVIMFVVHIFLIMYSDILSSYYLFYLLYFNIYYLGIESLLFLSILYFILLVLSLFIVFSYRLHVLQKKGLKEWESDYNSLNRYVYTSICMAGLFLYLVITIT